jgi:thiopurine S-methyltransferase
MKPQAQPDHDFWIGRWKRGEIGWHQTEPEPALSSYFSKLRPTRVFVPLCGKSLDLVWLHSHGHEVVGAELSALACETFFEENKISYEKKIAGDLTLYSSERLSIYQGDVFDLTTQELGRIGAIYDRAALIALPPKIRSRYAKHILSLIGQASLDFRFLQVVLERAPSDLQGPPFSVSEKEVYSLYESHFQIAILSRERVQLNNTPNESTAEECVFELRAKLV